MQPARLPLRVIRGATFNQPIRLSSPRQQWVDIQSIEATAPVRIKAPGHGLTADWMAWASGIAGFPDLNRELGRNEPLQVVYVDADTLELPGVDGVGKHASGGRLLLLRPLDLTGVTGRLQVRRDPEAAEVLLELTTASGAVVVAGPGLLRLRITDTEGLNFGRAWYGLDLTFPDGTVTRYLEGDLVAARGSGGCDG